MQIIILQRIIKITGGIKINYFTENNLLELQGDIIKFIKGYHKDSCYYDDFIDLIAHRDTSEELVLDLIDRDYLNDFMKHNKMYTILGSEEDVDEIILGDYINYFMDCSLIALLDYFTEISFIELLSYVDIYKYKEDYYAVWEI